MTVGIKSRRRLVCGNDPSVRIHERGNYYSVTVRQSVGIIFPNGIRAIALSRFLVNVNTDTRSVADLLRYYLPCTAIRDPCHYFYDKCIRIKRLRNLAIHLDRKLKVEV